MGGVAVTRVQPALPGAPAKASEGECRASRLLDDGGDGDRGHGGTNQGEQRGVGGKE